MKLLRTAFYGAGLLLLLPLVGVMLAGAVLVLVLCALVVMALISKPDREQVGIQTSEEVHHDRSGRPDNRPV